MLPLLLFALPAALAAPAARGPLTDSQARSLASAVIQARSTGVDVRSLLGSIFGGSDYNTDSDTYAPYTVSCPESITWIRNATEPSQAEQQYLQDRATLVNSTWSSRLSELGLSSPRTPNVGVALSGGGYRAMISGSGAGFLQNDTQGSVGDILALSNYAAGLSGGSWALTSFYANDGQSPEYLVNNVWNLDSNLVVPSDDALSFYYNIITDVATKRQDTPFETQITDYWALALTDHLYPSAYHPSGHPNFTFSSLANISSISNASLPYPIVVAAERQPGELVIAENATLWEFNIHEFGSWYFGSANKTIGGFTSMEYLGSNLTNGQADGQCWKGFDNIGFVAGTSSTLFNQGLLQVEATNSSSIVTSAIEEILGSVSSQSNDVATYPNPFAGWGEGYSPIANLPNLTLVDGGEPNTNLPLEPLLSPVRNLDAIIAIDSSADTNFAWPNGSALYTQYQRASGLAQKYNVTQRMPKVPSTRGFVNQGLNARPTFFGCNDTTTPIIVYVPNYPWSAWSNTSTFMLEYSTEQASAILENGRRTLDLNGTVSDWPTCLTCALIDNAVTENGGQRSSTCEGCFSRFCWNGIDDDSAPSEYHPTIGVAPSLP